MARIAYANHSAVPQDRRAVTEATHLIQAVRYVQDRPALSCEPIERAEEFFCLLGRQDGGWFIEDEQARILEQTSNDLDALPLADRKGMNKPIRFEGKTVRGGDLRETAPQGGPTFPAIERKGHVLDDSEAVEEREVLENHSDPEPTRRSRSVDHDRLAMPADRTGIRLQQPVQHLYQGGFTGTILAQKGMDLAWRDTEIDTIIRRKRAEPLHETGCGHDRGTTAIGNGRVRLTVSGVGHRRRQ
jgi:hypothetical protein